MATNYGLDTTAYDELKKKYNQSVDTSAKNQIADAKTNAQSQLKQAYVTRLQDERKLNNNLATAGIRGGATETSQLKLATNYGNNRNSINTTYANSVRDINQNAEANKLSYAQDIDAAKQQAVENYNAEQRGYEREDAQTAYDRNTAKYSSLFSTAFNGTNLTNLRAALAVSPEARTAKQTKLLAEYNIANYDSLSAEEQQILLQALDARLGYVKAIKKGGKWANTVG